MAIHMFQQLIDTLKKSPKRIVFTEGTDARILEASARLLAGTWLAPCWMLWAVVGTIELRASKVSMLTRMGWLRIWSPRRSRETSIWAVPRAYSRCALVVFIWISIGIV